MEFEIEELKDELETLNRKLIEIVNYDLTGIELNHKKFGNGKIMSQDGFRITIKFENEEKELQIPFVFVNKIVECRENYVLERMQEINNIQKEIQNIEKEIKRKETEIKRKETEIKLLKQSIKNKDENPNLFAVTTGISYNYILETKIYCCKSYRCKKICDYLGLYNEKSIVKIAKIKKIIEAERVSDKLVTNLVVGESITNEDFDNIKQYIKKGYEMFGVDIGQEKHKYFIVDKFYDTDYKKVSPHGIMEHKYFDLYKRLDVDTMPDIEKLAEDLQNIEW